MKGVFGVALLVCAAYIASAVPVQQSELIPGHYPRFIKFPDGEGVPHDVDLEEAPDMEFLSKVARNSAEILYLLYTKSNPDSAQYMVLNEKRSITKSNFNRRVPTVMIVHGWLSNQNTNFNTVIRDAFLAKGDVNIIVVDWQTVASSTYTTAVRAVPDVGRELAEFIAYLSSVGSAKLDSIHLVGFSLGAHVVGNAGRQLGGKIGRITGLDPAGPLWSFNSNRLNRNDAIYVEAIHTDGGYTAGGLGIGSAVADADFYPNGGISQPGCLTNICNHNRAWEFFAASVTYNHLIASRCSNSIQLSLNTCRGIVIPMGNGDLIKLGSGLYRVNTDRRYPF